MLKRVKPSVNVYVNNTSSLTHKRRATASLQLPFSIVIKSIITS